MCVCAVAGIKNANTLTHVCECFFFFVCAVLFCVCVCYCGNQERSHTNTLNATFLRGKTILAAASYAVVVASYAVVALLL